MSLKQSLLKIAELKETQLKLILEMIADNLITHKIIAKEIQQIVDTQLKDFELLKNSFILSTETHDNQLNIIPQSVQDFEQKKTQLIFDIEQAKIHEREKIENDIKLQAIKIKEEAELRKIKIETEEKAKKENGLIFGNWEIKKSYVEREMGYGNPKKKIEILVFRNQKERQLEIRYYIEENTMSFIYPYVDEIKNTMKSMGMTWINGGWKSSDWKVDLQTLSGKWPHIEKWEESKSFGSGRNRYTKETTFLNVFPECPEIITKIESLTQ